MRKVGVAIHQSLFAVGMENQIFHCDQLSQNTGPGKPVLIRDLKFATTERLLFTAKTV